MIRFERSTDYALLNRIVQRFPSLYPFLSDDFAPPLADVKIPECPELWYVTAGDVRGLLGFWMFEPRSALCWEFHTLMPLNIRATTAMRELLGPAGWLWRNTPCRRAVTFVAESNRIAYRFGVRAGLTEYGRNPESLLKNGKLQSQILLGISKPKE